MSGWIKLHRKFCEKAFYRKDSEKVHLWVHLLMSANHAGKEELLGGKPFFCVSGQFTTGRKQLSSETGISESKIERILTYFEKIEQQIEQQKTSTNRLISILNWGQYQQSEQQIEQQVNNDRTTSEQQVNNDRTHLKKEKKDKKDKKVRNNVENIFDYDSEPIQITILSFEEFWELYDKKVGDKERLRKKWEHVKEEDRLKIAEHIPAYRMTQPDKKYRKNPDTYLNNKSWNDEIIIPNGATKIGSANNGAQRDVNELAAILQKHINT